MSDRDWTPPTSPGTYPTEEWRSILYNGAAKFMDTCTTADMNQLRYAQKCKRWWEMPTEQFIRDPRDFPGEKPVPPFIQRLPILVCLAEDLGFALDPKERVAKLKCEDPSTWAKPILIGLTVENDIACIGKTC